MLDLLRLRLRLRRRRGWADSGRAPAGDARSGADARYAREVTAAWHALDDDAQAELLDAARELAQVRRQYGVTFVYSCRRGVDSRTGPLRTAADIRAEAAQIRASATSPCAGA